MLITLYALVRTEAYVRYAVVSCAINASNTLQ